MIGVQADGRGIRKHLEHIGEGGRLGADQRSTGGFFLIAS